MGRISRDEMYMKIAEAVALRGTCDRAYVGAVLVENDKNVIAIGYNGAPSGEPHCDDIGHFMVNGHCMRAKHAEENCLRKMDMRTDHNGYFLHTPQSPLTLYVTHYPCMECTQGLVRVKMNGLPLNRIVYKVAYRADEQPSIREALLKGAGITIEQLGGTVDGDKEPRL